MMFAMNGESRSFAVSSDLALTLSTCQDNCVRIILHFPPATVPTVTERVISVEVVLSRGERDRGEVIAVVVVIAHHWTAVDVPSDLGGPT